MRVKIILFLICSGYSLSVLAQSKLTKKQFLADSTRIVAPKLIRPQFRFDNRLTFLEGQKLNITGFDLGVLLKNKLRVTVGYYALSDELKSKTKIVNDTNYQSHYRLNYGAFNFEFIYKNTRFFALGMPLEFGLGSNTISYQSNNNDILIDKQTGFIAMAYFGLSGTFKPIRWIGLKAAFGYRKTIYNQIQNLSLSGLYTSVGISVDFREIITDYRMFQLKKRYRKKSSSLENAVDLITD